MEKVTLLQFWASIHCTHVESGRKQIRFTTLKSSISAIFSKLTGLEESMKIAILHRVLLFITINEMFE